MSRWDWVSSCLPVSFFPEKFETGIGLITTQRRSALLDSRGIEYQTQSSPREMAINQIHFLGMQSFP